MNTTFQHAVLGIFDIEVDEVQHTYSSGVRSHMIIGRIIDFDHGQFVKNSRSGLTLTHASIGTIPAYISSATFIDRGESRSGHKVVNCTLIVQDLTVWQTIGKDGRSGDGS